MSDNKDNLLEVINVSYNINKKSILHNVNFKIKNKEILTLIGPNGSGKTTLAKILISSMKPSEGKIIFHKNTQIGYIPQKIYFDALLPLKVEDFLKLNINYHNNIEEFINIINIEYLFKMQISQISGGELQKVLLISSLLSKPDLLIMDEPTQGLDINSQSEFYNLINEIRNKYSISILLISHDLHMVMKTTDYVICLNKHICCQGKPKNIVLDQNFTSLFDKNIINNFATYAHSHNHTH